MITRAGPWALVTWLWLAWVLVCLGWAWISQSDWARNRAHDALRNYGDMIVLGDVHLAGLHRPRLVLQDVWVGRSPSPAHGPAEERLSLRRLVIGLDPWSLLLGSARAVSVHADQGFWVPSCGGVAEAAGSLEHVTLTALTLAPFGRAADSDPPFTVDRFEALRIESDQWRYAGRGAVAGIAGRFAGDADFRAGTARFAARLGRGTADARLAWQGACDDLRLDVAARSLTLPETLPVAILPHGRRLLDRLLHGGGNGDAGPLTIALSGSDIRFGRQRFRRIAAMIALEAGRVRLEAEIDAVNGSAGTAALVLAGDDAGASTLSLAAAMPRLALPFRLADRSWPDWLSGSAGIDLSLRGPVPREAAGVARLSGTLAVRDLSVTVDIDAMPDPAANALILIAPWLEDETPLTPVRGAGDLSLEHGVISLEGAWLDAENVRMQAEGTIDLAENALHIEVYPDTEGEAGPVPVLVIGPLDHPAVLPYAGGDSR